jgi:alkylation response protein AidB-like acyl-CoA dehydrogenase
MDLSYGADYDRYREEVRTFLDANWPPRGADAQLSETEQVDAFRVKAIAAGYLARSIPKQYGGSGQALDLVKSAAIDDEFRRAEAPEDPADLGYALLIPTLLECGEEWQKEKFIPPTVRGEIRWCQGYSEPGAGSDLASVQTRGELVGDEWVINGQKIWTSEGHTANWIFVLCRTDPDAPKHRGISFLLCPMDQPGIEVRPIVNMVGSHDFNEVFFTDAKTHVDNVIGGVNDGWRVTNQLLAYERGDDSTTVSLRMQGVLDRLLDVARSTGKINDPVVRQDLAWCHSKVEILRFLGLRSLTAVLSNSVLGPESSINKLLWSELFQRMTEIGVNLFGASAAAPDGDAPLSPVFTETTGDPRSSLAMVEHFLGARPASIYSGSNEIQRNILGERMLGLPKEPRADEGPWAETRRAV